MYQDIVTFLTPFFARESQCEAILLNAFYGHEAVLRKINYSGSAAEFVPRLINVLQIYGQVKPGISALWYLLLSLKNDVGPDKQNQIERFKEWANRSETPGLKSNPFLKEVRTPQPDDVKKILPMFEWLPVKGGPVKLNRGVWRLKERKKGLFGTEHFWEYDSNSDYTDTVPEFLVSSPITNQQFASFINSPDGYRDSRSWTTTWDRALKEPEFQGDDYIRVNINFYEAEAFCYWLTMKVHYGDWSNVGREGFYPSEHRPLFWLLTERHWQHALKQQAIYKNSAFLRAWEWTETRVDRPYLGSSVVWLEEGADGKKFVNQNRLYMPSFVIVRGGTQPFNISSPFDDLSRYVAPMDAQTNAIGFRIMCYLTE